MSNLRLALLVGLALLLVVIFGHNPMDEVRKKRAEKAGQKLVQKIEDANKKNKGQVPPMQARPNFAAQPGNNGVTTNPYVQQNKPGGNAPAAPKDEYYPPAPKNPNVKIPLSSLHDANGMVLAKKLFRNPNLVTDDGKALAFWGTKVYVFDNDGKLKPIPDGRYVMYDGRWTMVIRDGEQTIADRGGLGFDWGR